MRTHPAFLQRADCFTWACVNTQAAQEAMDTDRRKRAGYPSAAAAPLPYAGVGGMGAGMGGAGMGGAGMGGAGMGGAGMGGGGFSMGGGGGFTAEEEAPVDDGKPKGQYKIRGQWYLQADYHHELIVPGASCQAIYGEDGDWYDATIMSSRVIPVPNTDIILRKVYVQYAGYGDMKEVPADAVRFKVDQPAIPVPDSDDEEQAPAAGATNGVPPPPPPAPDAGADAAATVSAAAAAPNEKVELDPTTGLGKWQTVRIIDTEAEAKAARLQDKISKRKEKQKKRKAPELNDSADFATDAYQTANPYGGNYRGITLTSADASDGDDDDDVGAGGGAATGAAAGTKADADVPEGHVLLNDGRVIPAPPPRRLPPPPPPRPKAPAEATAGAGKAEATPDDAPVVHKVPVMFKRRKIKKKGSLRKKPRLL